MLVTAATRIPVVRRPVRVAILVAIVMMVVIAFSLATYGAFSVSSTAECLKDSELVRKDTELRLNIPELCMRCATPHIHVRPFWYGSEGGRAGTVCTKKNKVTNSICNAELSVAAVRQW